jgi:hypothetical protein
MSALLARRNEKFAKEGKPIIHIEPINAQLQQPQQQPHQSPVFNIHEFISWLYVQKAGVCWDRQESVQFIKNKCREKGFRNSDEEIAHIFNTIHTRKMYL